MTVAQVVLTLDPGGQEFLVIELAARLQAQGHRSPIIALSEGALVDAARARGIETFALGKRPGFDVRLLWRLHRLLRQLRCDVIHTHNFGPLIYGALAGRSLNTPVINTRHGRAALSTNRWIWKLTSHVVAVSQDARRELLRHNNLPATKVTVILNGIDVQSYRRARADDHSLRQSLGIADEDCVFICVARLSPEKGHDTLIDAFAVVLRAAPRSRLVIVGGGKMEAALKEQAERLGIGGCVHFLGFRDDVAAVLHSADAFVLASLMEGVSLTLLEAMAAGLPIVTTAVGGNPEVVVDGETGILVPARDAKSFAEGMRRICSDRTLAEELGQRGQARAFSQFDIGSMIDAYLAVYAAAVSRP
jgi:sugar transferase (PEP-CTERM/EpsH1 system associated)